MRLRALNAVLDRIALAVVSRTIWRSNSPYDKETDKTCPSR